MKRQASTNTYIGEERVHSDGGSLFKKFFEKAQKPVVNTEVIKKTQKAVASEAKAELNTALSQILGVELKAGKTHALKKEAQEKTQQVEPPRNTLEHMRYFAEFKKATENKRDNPETSAIRSKLDAILAELRKLKDSSDELEAAFRDVVVDEVPEKPGVYHLTFYEGFLRLVMKMRDKIEDGVIFAKLFKSRKQERSYHSMAKKGGTSYTLHHDRSVATQTG